MGVQPLLEVHCPTHGTWVGRRLGWVTVIWLTPILSEADHRLHHVPPWAQQRLPSLRGATGQPGHRLDRSDDRLAAVLEMWRHDQRWQAFEGAVTPHLRRVDDLQAERGRRDTTTASGDGRVSEDGLLPFGHSKDHRPDLPPVTVRLSVLAPLGWPVAPDVVPGPRADAPWYGPAITRVRARGGRRGRLVVGDRTMGALATRASWHAGGDCSRCPLSAVQRPPAGLAGSGEPMATGHQAVTRITRLTGTGPRQDRADGYARLAPLGLVGAARNARGRGQRRFRARPALPAAGATIRTRYRVRGRLAVQYTERVHPRRRRRDGRRPATGPVERHGRVKAVVDRPAVPPAIRRLGGRVDATNAPPHHLALAQAVLAYRRPYLVEHDSGRLKGHPLSLTPRSLPRDAQATGLIRLLSIGWRVLTLLACVVRQRLAAARTTLAGLSVGHPTRATARPPTERRLQGVEGLTRTILREGRRRQDHLTPLSRGPRRMLTLLNGPVDI